MADLPPESFGFEGLGGANWLDESSLPMGLDSPMLLGFSPRGATPGRRQQSSPGALAALAPNMPSFSPGATAKPAPKRRKARAKPKERAAPPLERSGSAQRMPPPPPRRSPRKSPAASPKAASPKAASPGAAARARHDRVGDTFNLANLARVAAARPKSPVPRRKTPPTRTLRVGPFDAASRALVVDAGLDPERAVSVPPGFTCADLYEAIARPWRGLDGVVVLGNSRGRCVYKFWPRAPPRASPPRDTRSSSCADTQIVPSSSDDSRDGVSSLSSASRDRGTPRKASPSPRTHRVTSSAGPLKQRPPPDSPGDDDDDADAAAEVARLEAALAQAKRKVKKRKAPDTPAACWPVVVSDTTPLLSPGALTNTFAGETPDFDFGASPPASSAKRRSASRSASRSRSSGGSSRSVPYRTRPDAPKPRRLV